MNDDVLRLYGRRPVLAALEDNELVVERVLLAKNVQGPTIDQIRDAATARQVRIENTTRERVTRYSGHAQQDQGVVAFVRVPSVRPLDDLLNDRRPGTRHIFLLAGVVTPANVGMIIRTAHAAGLAGIVLPEYGSPGIDAYVIKASAGTALHAPIWRTPTALDAASTAKAAGYSIVGLAADAPESLYDVAVPETAMFVLGNESAGIDDRLSKTVDQWVRIPMVGSTESINVAVAAGVVAFELLRRTVTV